MGNAQSKKRKAENEHLRKEIQIKQKDFKPYAEKKRKLEESMRNAKTEEEKLAIQKDIDNLNEANKQIIQEMMELTKNLLKQKRKR